MVQTRSFARKPHSLVRLLKIWIDPNDISWATDGIEPQNSVWSFLSPGEQWSSRKWYDDGNSLNIFFSLTSVQRTPAGAKIKGLHIFFMDNFYSAWSLSGRPIEAHFIHSARRGIPWIPFSQQWCWQDNRYRQGIFLVKHKMDSLLIGRFNALCISVFKAPREVKMNTAQVRGSSILKRVVVMSIPCCKTPVEAGFYLPRYRGVDQFRIVENRLRNANFFG